MCSYHILAAARNVQTSPHRQGYNYHIYVALSSPLVQEYEYSRRLPSFRGGNTKRRMVLPVHLATGEPVWE
jgi:hypothetical protein